MAASASTQLREGWQELPLIECTSDRQISYGVVQPGFPVTDGVPIVRVNNLVNGRIITNDAMRVAPEIDYSHRRTKLHGGEIVISLVGTTGSVAIVPDELSGWNVARAIAVIRPDEKIGASWLKLCLESSHTREYLDARANTTVQKTLNLKDVKQLPIPLPPPHWRQEILSLISPIENAITNLEDQNRSLEATAQAVFKSWFVDFDPVRSKAEGREPEGMDAATAALFPSEFEDSELGEIPLGWKVKSIGDISISNRKSISKDYAHPEIEYVDISSVDPGRITSTSVYSLAEAPSRAKRLVRDGDTIWSCVRPNRRSYAIILEPTDNLVVSTGFVTLTATEVPFSFLYLSLTTSQFVEYLTLRADGAAYPAVRPDTFESAKVTIPAKSIANRFHEIVEPILRTIAANDKQAKSLADLRDTLLPRLISGKLRVPEAEAMLMGGCHEV